MKKGRSIIEKATSIIDKIYIYIYIHIYKKKTILMHNKKKIKISPYPLLSMAQNIHSKNFPSKQPQIV
jgi:phosphopantetheine adenylyltransferase